MQNTSHTANNTQETSPLNQPNVLDKTATNHKVTDFSHIEADFATLAPEPLSPSYPWMLLLKTQIMLPLLWLPLLFVASKFTDALPPFIQSYWKEGVWIFIALWILWSGYVWLSAKYEGYVVRERDVSFYSGILYKEVVIQPLTRLQHIEIGRSLIERFFELATLKLYSAGGDSHAIAISGLTHTQAEQLRHYILQNQALSDDR